MNKTDLMTDLGRGFAGKCLQCGEGKLFARWLKVTDTCACCGEAYHHHRADDFPAYVVILIQGHLMVTLALGLEEAFAPPSWVHLATIIPLTIVTSLLMLQPVKGAIVALQWRMGMHGFKESFLRREETTGKTLAD
jgi:uncharacterized protein (DUF983 family)